MTPPRTRLILRTIGPALAAGLAFGACGGGGGDEGVASGDGLAGDSAAAEVDMKLVAFTPETLEITAGTTVTWTQRDAGSHTATSGTVEQGSSGVTQQPDGDFDSGSLATGEEFEHTFDEPGTYPYFCSLHPATMRGEIRVT